MRFSNILIVLDTRHPDRARALHRAAAFARIEGAHLTVSEADSWVAVDVARLVRNGGHDLVIKPFAGHRTLQFVSGAKEDRELMRSCPCPVWLVNVAEQCDNKSMLVALDMPAKGDFETELNKRIIEVSRSIALAESRPLHFVHAWRLRGEGHLRAQRNPATDLQIDRMRAREEASRKSWLQNTVATPADERHSAIEQIATELHVPYGHAKKVIPDLAENLGAGLIVMGTAARRKKSGIERRNTAETVLPRSDCSLLVINQPRQLPAQTPQDKQALQPG